jgi:hypothetical protein
LSYVLAALTPDEVHEASRWLHTHPVTSGVEVVLAAPAEALARIPARVIPAGIRLASAPPTADRKLVRTAGARITTGLVVMVVDCNENLDQQLARASGPGSRDPGGPFEDPSTWAGRPEEVGPPDSAAIEPVRFGD